MKKASILLLLVFMALGLMNCTPESEYPGYAKSQAGYYYKLSKIGDGGPKCQYNDYVTLDICYKTTNDSVFFKGRRKISNIKT